MKRWLKVLWICVAITFAAGLAISVAAFAAGARGLYADQTGLHSTGDYFAPETISESDLEAFNSIDIGLVSTDLRFVKSDSYGYEIKFTTSYPLEVSHRDGKLSIRENVQFFGFNLFVFDPNRPKRSVTIYLPQESSLDSLNLETVSGNTEFEALDLDVNNFVYEAVSGNLKVSDGSLRAQEASVKSISGTVDFTGTASERLGIDTLSGDISFTLFASPDDYRLSLDKASGDVRVNGQLLGDADDWPLGRWSSGDSSAPGRIDIKLISGDVDLSFAE